MTMERYRVELLPAAEKDLERLRQWEARIIEVLLELETNPSKGDLLSGSLKGVRSLKFHLRGSGAYRAAYVISGQTCVVFYIGTRENAYQEIARRAKRLPR
jgi:mRNA-degrading endonuclease RelE of RelBE toxin-antitoxin system